MTSTLVGCDAHGVTSPWASPDARLILRAGAPRGEWLRHRRTGLGSSDASAILGLSKWSSPYEVWAEKRGLLPEEPASEAMELGNLLEPIVVNRWSDTSGIPIRKAGLMASREWPFMLASVDRLAACGGIVEAKTLSYRVADEWDDGQTPDHAEAQVQHQMAVTGRDHAHVVGLQDGRTWLERRINRDDELIADIVAVEREMWRLIVEGIEPPIDGSSMTTDVLNNRWPGHDDVEIELPADALDIIRNRAQHLDIVDAAQLEADRLANEVRALMGDATVGILPINAPCKRCKKAACDITDRCCDPCAVSADGHPRLKVTWNRNGTFGRKRFEGEHPDIAAAITHPMPTFDLGALQRGRPELYQAFRARVLRVPKIKEVPTDG